MTVIILSNYSLDEFNGHQSTSDLSYVESLSRPRARVIDVDEEFRMSTVSESLSNDPMVNPPTVNRNGSLGSSSFPYPASTERYLKIDGSNTPGPSNIVRSPTQLLRNLMYGGTARLELHDELEEEYWEDEDDEADRFVNFALLSHLAVQLRDKVQRGTHVKGGVPYPRAFTGKDIVVRQILLPFLKSVLTRLTVDNSITNNERAVRRS